MVATGYVKSTNAHSDHVEVINTQTLQSCSTLPQPYPYDNDMAMSMKHQDKAVICGGRAGDTSSPTSDCYSYDYVNDKWDIEPFRLEPERYEATSVEIKPNEWMILGGQTHDDNNNHFEYSDTKILRNGQFFDGPDLPKAMFRARAVMLDEERLLLTDGFETNRTFILNVTNYQWMEVAPRLNSPRSAVMGTFFNSSANELQVAHISDYIAVYSPKDDHWWFSSNLPDPMLYLQSSVAIQQGPNEFIMIGGLVNLEYSGDIYHFDENGFTVIKQNVLVEPRQQHIAIPIPIDQFSC